MADWGAFGFGTDPAGDAARHDATSHTTITVQELAALRAGECRALTGPDPADDPPVPGHLLTYRTGKTGTEVTCECGRWDGWYNGPRSRRRVLDDHADHVAVELHAAGPVIVESVRVDLSVAGELLPALADPCPWCPHPLSEHLRDQPGTCLHSTPAETWACDCRDPEEPE